MSWVGDVIHHIVPREIRDPIKKYVTKPIESTLWHVIPREILNPLSDVVGMEDIKDWGSWFPKELQKAIPKEISQFSLPELAGAAYLGMQAPGWITAAAANSGSGGGITSSFLPKWAQGIPGLTDIFNPLNSLTEVDITDPLSTGNLFPDWLSKGMGLAKDVLSKGWNFAKENWIPLTLGSGVLADYMSNKSQANIEQGTKDELAKQMDKYMEEQKWTDAERANMMKGVYGSMADYLQGQRTRAAADYSASGIGGGGYESEIRKSERKALNKAAGLKAATYGPANISPAVYQLLAQAYSPTQSATSRTLSDLTSLGGNALSQYLMFKYMNDIFSK